MKITVKPKKVDVLHKETKSYYSEYTCPSCKILYQGNCIGKNITRFICDCGQELIVNNLN
jgi:hypothetical protein